MKLGPKLGGEFPFGCFATFLFKVGFILNSSTSGGLYFDYSRAAWLSQLLLLVTPITFWCQQIASASGEVLTLEQAIALALRDNPTQLCRFYRPVTRASADWKRGTCGQECVMGRRPTTH